MKKNRWYLVAISLVLLTSCSLFSDDSDDESITVITPDPPSLTANIADLSVDISWSYYSSSEADNIEIFRNGSKIAMVSYYETSYTDENLSVGPVYTYKLRLIKSGTAGNYSTEKSVTLAVGEFSLELRSPEAVLIDKQYYQRMNLTLKLDSTQDLYFIFTNTDETYSVYSSDYAVSSSDGVSFSSATNVSTFSRSESATNVGFVEAVLPSVGELIEGEQSLSQKSLFSVSASAASVGDAEYFWEVAPTKPNSVPATCRKVVDVGSKTLNIWVEDDCWHDGGTKSKLITPTMVDAMADKFLQTGDDNDIYDWVTNICGEEWGSSSKSNLISEGQPIDILLCDIENDGYTTGGVLGYFWSGNALTTESYSNQRVMFCIDAPIYANGDGTWDVSDKYPKIQISTLAHEFQHMINYYQLSVKKDVTQATWLNEMLSMSIEDLVAYKLYGDYDSSPYYSRFSELNSYNDYSLGKWESDTKYYALNYGFGSYLLRQFDGTNFVKSIYSTGNEDTDAVESATGESFATLMRNWGAAYLLSDQSLNSGDFAYNADTSSKLGDISYNLVEVNAYNVYNNYNKKVEPKVCDLSSPQDIGSLANKYYLVKEDMPAGSYSFTVNMWDDDLELTVVAK